MIGFCKQNYDKENLIDHFKLMLRRYLKKLEGGYWSKEEVLKYEKKQKCSILANAFSRQAVTGKDKGNFGHYMYKAANTHDSAMLHRLVSNFQSRYNTL